MHKDNMWSEIKRQLQKLLSRAKNSSLAFVVYLWNSLVYTAAVYSCQNRNKRRGKGEREERLVVNFVCVCCERRLVKMETRLRRSLPCPRQRRWFSICLYTDVALCTFLGIGSCFRASYLAHPTHYSLHRYR